MQKKGYTLVEILIATGIFLGFCVGLFTLHRMGVRMFTSGSWKLQKQKEAERFLAVLKERLEQASNASQINPARGVAPVLASAPVIVLENNTVVTEPAQNTRLMLFSVCKPDLSLIDPTQAGMVLYHSLMAVPTPVPGSTRVNFTLNLHANTNPIAHNGIDYFNSPKDFRPDPASFTDFVARFNNTPQQFMLGTVPFTARLSDVMSVRVEVTAAPGMTDVEGGKIVGLRIRMQHPRYPETTVDQVMHAKIDSSVPVDQFTLGGF